MKQLAHVPGPLVANGVMCLSPPSLRAPLANKKLTRLAKSVDSFLRASRHAAAVDIPGGETLPHLQV